MVNEVVPGTRKREQGRECETSLCMFFFLKKKTTRDDVYAKVGACLIE